MGYVLSDWGRTKIANAATELKIVAGISGAVIAAGTFFVGTEVWRAATWRPLERAYWGAYVRSWGPVSGLRDAKGRSEYVIHCKKRRGARVTGTSEDDGTIVAVQNEEAQWGARGLELRAEAAREWESYPVRGVRADAGAHEWLKENVYGGRTVVEKFLPPWYGAGVLWAAVIGAAGWWSARERERARARKVLRGTEVIGAREFGRRITGDGLGIPHVEKKRVEYLRIRSGDETRHVQVAGDIGTGKSVLLHWFLHEIGKREMHRVACYDPALEFWRKHGRAERGDVLLHPLAEGCPFWDLGDEIRNPADATQLAQSFLPNREEGRTDFWDMAPQRLLAFLLVEMRRRKLGVSDLLRWMARPEEVDEMVRGTDLAALIADNADAQRAGVFASMNAIADALKLLPPDDGRARFSFRKWAESGRGWIFIASRPNERRALRPLVSAWLDTLFGRLMTKEGGRATWCFVDELPTLQRLPSLKEAVQESRKYNLRFVLGFQGRAQLEALYRREAETLMSAPQTRIFLKTTEYAAAEWMAKNIGMAEQTREAESLTASVGAGRDSVNYREERRVEYVVLPNEIQNLTELSGYLRYDKYVTAIKFAPLGLEVRNEFRERRMAMNEFGRPAAETKGTGAGSGKRERRDEANGWRVDDGTVTAAEMENERKESPGAGEASARADAPGAMKPEEAATRSENEKGGDWSAEVC
jgi:hypothetical protein